MSKPKATVSDVVAEMNRAAAGGDVRIHNKAFIPRMEPRFDSESIVDAINQAIKEGRLDQPEPGFLKLP